MDYFSYGATSQYQGTNWLSTWRIFIANICQYVSILKSTYQLYVLFRSYFHLHVCDYISVSRHTKGVGILSESCWFLKEQGKPCTRLGIPPVIMSITQIYLSNLSVNKVLFIFWYQLLTLLTIIVLYDQTSLTSLIKCSPLGFNHWWS